MPKLYPRVAAACLLLASPARAGTVTATEEPPAGASVLLQNPVDPGTSRQPLARYTEGSPARHQTGGQSFTSDTDFRLTAVTFRSAQTRRIGSGGVMTMFLSTTEDGGDLSATPLAEVAFDASGVRVAAEGFVRFEFSPEETAELGTLDAGRLYLLSFRFDEASDDNGNILIVNGTDDDSFPGGAQAFENNPAAFPTTDQRPADLEFYLEGEALVPEPE